MSELNNDLIKGTYTADSIGGSNNPLLAIREDISRWLGSNGIRAIVQMLREIVENSLDEETFLVENIWKNTDISLSILVQLRKDGSVLVKDQGRGIPVDLKDIEDIGNQLSKLKLQSFKYNKGELTRKHYEKNPSKVYSEITNLDNYSEETKNYLSNASSKHLKAINERLLTDAEVYSLPDDLYISYIEGMNSTWVNAVEYKKRVAPAIIHALENDTVGGKGVKGGRSSNNAYRGSRTGGVHGAGMCATLAACEYFRVTNTLRETSKSYIVQYERAVRTVEFQEIPTVMLSNGVVDYGYTVEFKYDDTLFNLYDNKGALQEYPFDIQELTNLFRNYVLASNRINIIFQYELPSGESNKIIFKASDYSPEEYVKKHSINNKVYTASFSDYDDSDPQNILDYELAIYSTVSNNTNVMSFVNKLVTSKSSVKDAYFNTLEICVSDKFRVNKTLNPNVPLTIDIRRRHVTAILMLGIDNPNFSGQIKDEFHNPRLMNKLNTAFLDYFSNKEGAELVNEIYKQILPEYLRKIEEYNKSEEMKSKKELMQLRTKSAKRDFTNERLTLPNNPNYRECFLLLVEGDSGERKLSGFMSSTDKLPNKFAIFRIKGKLLNVLTGDILKSNDREMFEMLFNALDKYPWRRIVAFTDGDTDGYHIRDLIASLMVDQYPQMIVNRRFSILQSPVCKIRFTVPTSPEYPKGYREVFMFSTEAADAFIESHSNEIISSTSYKGIGSLSDEDLLDLLSVGPDGNLVNEYIVYPTDNTLSKEKEILEKFFGKSVHYRKNYLDNTFMTENFSQYTATRNERLRDLDIKFNLYPNKSSGAALTTEGMLMRSGLTTEFDVELVKDYVYETTVEFLYKMANKYNASVDNVNNLEFEVENANTEDEIDLETVSADYDDVDDSDFED